MRHSCAANAMPMSMSRICYNYLILGLFLFPKPEIALAATNLISSRRQLTRMSATSMSGSLIDQEQAVDLSADPFDFENMSGTIIPMDNTERINAPLEAGQPYHRKNLGWPLIKATLLHYQAFYGNLLVPTSFVVPSGGWGWPKRSWDVRLGVVVQTIRRGSYKDRRDELLDMGFCFDVYEARYQLVRSALLLYKEMNGNVLVPQGYIVPKNSDLWPQEMLGFKLGMVVHCIRTRKVYVSHHDDLLSIGFDFESQLRYGLNSFKIALSKYQEINGHMFVNATYTVPEKDPNWPKELWGMRLGHIVQNVRKGFYFRDRHEELKRMGFTFSLSEIRFHSIKCALLIYKKIHGNLMIPIRFIINDRNEWPEEYIGMKLGSTVSCIRKGLYPNKREELLSLGFIYIQRKKYDYETVKIAVYKYRELYNGETKIPPKWNIPQNDLWFPEETWGMCLGNICKRIKKGDLFPGKITELFGEYDK